MKKTPLIIGGTVLTLALIGGGIFAFQALGSRTEIEVIPCFLCFNLMVGRLQ